MDSYRIQSWSGRLGNNLLQISNALSLAQRDRGEFVLDLPHPLLEPFVVRFCEAGDAPVRIRRGTWFYGVRVPAAERRQLLAAHVRPHLRLDQGRPPLPDATLVIHLRGGDIFAPGPNAKYVQPPLEFYRQVIEENPFDEILLVAESSRMNPCAAALQAAYPTRCRIQTGALADDVVTILRARHLCCNSVGTFGGALALLSVPLRALHMPVYSIPESPAPLLVQSNDYIDGFDWFGATLPGIDVALYLVSDYVLPGNWTADAAQRESMLTLPRDRIRRVK